jgi:hypothetical protein
MTRKTPKRLNFTIDKLTSSIENKHTGENFETEILRVQESDKLNLDIGDWQFDWNLEESIPGRVVYKLVTKENPGIIHGLISLEERPDHIFVHLLESASFNIGAMKSYLGVPANLVAFACKMSFEKGHNGFVSFISKTYLIDHYEKTLLAKRLAANRMFIDTGVACILVTKYFKDFDNG